MTQPFLDDKIRFELSSLLAGLQAPVEIVAYTGSRLVLPGADPTGLQDEALQLLREVANLSDKLSLLEKPIAGDEEATRLGITRAPTILLREAGSSRTNIRFLGLPSGYEFSTLIETIRMLSAGDTPLGARSRAEIAKVTSPITMQTFVTPTCPHCPRAVLTAYQFAFHNQQVIAEGVEAGEFPQLSRRFGISGVPDTIITGQSVQRVLGGQPDRVFVEATLKAAGLAA